MALTLDEIINSVNVAELLSDKKLAEIGTKVIDMYELDEESRADWQERVDRAMEIAKQTMEVKNTPWANASNVKYPLITKAAIDFAARTYPELVQNGRVARAETAGYDPDGAKFLRAQRVSKFMSYQLLQQSDDWEESLDRLLHILPIVGTVFKKTYFDPLKKRPVSELCRPDQIVVNYNISSLGEARRISHRLSMHRNSVIERQRADLFIECDLKELEIDSDDLSNAADEDAPLELIEQHCFLDLDDDGYQEPYVVTVHKESRKVLRVVHRFKEIEYDTKKKVRRITPEQYFVDYHFIKSPDGGFYSVGLGPLLYPLNEAVNTLLNQLIDAGTLNNQQGGFLGRGLRLKNGEFRLKLGEWKVLDAAAGTNLQQSIIPLPTKEPSQTLFQLLGLLIEVGKDLISANDVMAGKGQTQNVASSTILAMVEQGMKVFNAIHKRIFKSLRTELMRFYELNSTYLSQDEYARFHDEPVDVKRDFDITDMDILPVADPSMSSDMQRISRAEALMKVPGIDMREGAYQFLRALQLDEQSIARLLPPKDPNEPPPAEVQKLLAEAEKAKAEAKAAIMNASVQSSKNILDAERLRLQGMDVASRVDESAARIMKMKEDATNSSAKIQLAGAKADHQAKMNELNLIHNREKDEIELSLQALALKNDDANEGSPDDAS